MAATTSCGRHAWRTQSDGKARQAHLRVAADLADNRVDLGPAVADVAVHWEAASRACPVDRERQRLGHGAGGRGPAVRRELNSGRLPPAVHGGERESARASNSGAEGRSCCGPGWLTNARPGIVHTGGKARRAADGAGSTAPAPPQRHTGGTSRERLLRQQAGRRGLPRTGVAAHPRRGALRVRPRHALGSSAQWDAKAQHCGHLQQLGPEWAGRAGPGSRAGRN